MKITKLFALAACAAAMFAVTGCSKGHGGGPEGVVLSYFGAIKSGELSEALMRDITTDHYFHDNLGWIAPDKRAQRLERMNAGWKQMLRDTSMRIEEVTVTGDTAIVNARLVGEGVPHGKENGFFDLKLVDGAWKIDNERTR